MIGPTYLKARLVICNEEDTDGRARATADEEQVLAYTLTERRSSCVVQKLESNGS